MVPVYVITYSMSYDRRMSAFNEAAKDLCYTYKKSKRRRETLGKPLEYVNRR